MGIVQNLFLAYENPLLMKYMGILLFKWPFSFGEPKTPSWKSEKFILVREKMYFMYYKFPGILIQKDSGNKRQQKKLLEDVIMKIPII